MTPKIAFAVLATLMIGAAVPAGAQSPTPAPSAPASTTPAAPTAKPPSAADLSSARTKLAELEKDIKAGESGSKRLQTQLRGLASAVSNEQGTLQEIRTNLDATHRQSTAVKNKLQALKEKVRSRARSLYKQGPADMIGVLLGASSMRDFVGRFTFANSLAKQDKALVLETSKRRAELGSIQAHQEQLKKQQETTVASLQSQQDKITDVFARQQVILAKLAHARGQALELIGRLEAVLGPNGLGGVKRVAGRGMTISYGEWAEAFLSFIGAPVVRENLIAVVAWEASEGTQATWNPLATTMPWPGATTYNSHNVRNYQTKEDGLNASRATLLRPGHGYEKILDSLERGADAMETGKAINASDWCRGCTNGQYVIGIIPAVERYYDRYAN